MSRHGLSTPVILLIFNRPVTTARVFATIRAARPARLFVIADGPRPDRPADIQRCAAARAATDQVDWPCEVMRNYAPTNLGLADRVAGGISAVFAEVEEAIILEDDCLPDPSFFRFCNELLDHYRDDERVMAISGDNFQRRRQRGPGSYYFSRYNHCWGWATWRRAWAHYDHQMRLWPTLRDGGWLNDMFAERRAVRFWTSTLQAVYQGRINSWAYRWTLACWAQSGLTILPNRNLVTNIGFGAEATNTSVDLPEMQIAANQMLFPLRHPQFVIRDARADRFTQATLFTPGVLQRVRNRLRRMVTSRLPC